MGTNFPFILAALDYRKLFAALNEDGVACGGRKTADMAINYNISTLLNMTIFVCEGLVTSAEFLEVIELVSSDPRYKRSMIRIIDLFSMEGRVEWKDMQYAVKRMQSLAKEEGLELGPLVVLSNSTGINLLAEAINSLPASVPFKLNVYRTLDAAINALGLSDVAPEINRFWEESHSDHESRN